MSAARWVRRRPVTTFLVLTLGVVGSALGTPRLTGHSISAEHLDLALPALAFVLLFGSALMVTAIVDGRPGVHRLLAGIAHWRIGAGRWLLVTAALPALTLIIAVGTGTLRHPPEGWLRMGLTYLVTGLLVGAVLTNVWEEAAWAGFIQHRLMGRHGLFVGSLLTAVPFTLIHVAGAFQNTPAGGAMVEIGILAVLAPFIRYLIGAVLLDTRGSILAVGFLHASFNAAGQLSAADGGWQFLPALILLTLAVGVHRRLRRGRRPARPRAGQSRRPAVYARRRTQPDGRSRLHARRGHPRAVVGVPRTVGPAAPVEDLSGALS